MFLMHFLCHTIGNRLLLSGMEVWNARVAAIWTFGS